MCEVTARNFNEALNEIEIKLKQTRFISIDLEFSCLTASEKLQNSLFDSADERYTKLRKTIEQIVPLQVGLTLFTFDPDNNAYEGEIYNFYVFPRHFIFLDTTFLCQASSLGFLFHHNYDFNKFVREGVSFLNRTRENELCKFLENENTLLYNFENLLYIEQIIEQSKNVLNKWFEVAKDGDILILNNMDIFVFNVEVKLYLHIKLRSTYKNLWTFEDNEGFKVQKVTPEQYTTLMKGCKLKEGVILDLLGFTRIFRLLVSAKKTIIGHNLLIDLMMMIHHFENPLPKSYIAFKKLSHSLFPLIYDTKYISHEVYYAIPEGKRWAHNSLEHLYDFFKNKYGRHLVANSPTILHLTDSEQDFHSAGWDAFCTGYIFIRMAHMFAVDKWNVKGKKFMSSELLQAVMPCKNKINLIKGNVSHIQLDDEDPVSKRPPWLIVENLQNKKIDLNKVTTLLGSVGYVEVKPCSLKGHRAIVAVDNFSSAKRILKQFATNPEFSVQQYSFIKHSPIVRTTLWYSVILTGAALAIYGYTLMN